MKVQTVLQLQSGALQHLVECTNPVGFNSTASHQQNRGHRPCSLSLHVVPPHSRLWLHFIDNDGALVCLVSGCSKSTSLSAVVDYTQAQIPVLGSWPWFERVPSKCNIVDGPSRKNFSTSPVNDWVRDSAQLPEPLLDMTHARS